MKMISVNFDKNLNCDILWKYLLLVMTVFARGFAHRKQPDELFVSFCTCYFIIYSWAVLKPFSGCGV